MSARSRYQIYEQRPPKGDIAGIKLRLVHQEQAAMEILDKRHDDAPLIVGLFNRREVCRLSSALAELAVHMRNSP